MAWAECLFCGKIYAARPSTTGCCSRHCARSHEALQRKPVMHEDRLDRFLALVREDFARVFKPKK